MRSRTRGAGGFMSAFHRYSALLLFATLLLTSACSGRKELNRAIKLEKDGNFSAALDSYRAQLAKTAPRNTQRASELQHRIGECLMGLERPSEAFSAYNKAA